MKIIKHAVSRNCIMPNMSKPTPILVSQYSRYVLLMQRPVVQSFLFVCLFFCASDPEDKTCPMFGFLAICCEGSSISVFPRALRASSPEDIDILISWFCSILFESETSFPFWSLILSIHFVRGIPETSKIGSREEAISNMFVERGWNGVMPRALMRPSWPQKPKINRPWETVTANHDIAILSYRNCYLSWRPMHDAPIGIKSVVLVGGAVPWTRGRALLRMRDIDYPPPPLPILVKYNIPE